MTGGLHVGQLHFQFESLPILNGIDLDIPQGELCAVVGQSGAGKTTLIKCLLQADWASAGTVDYSGSLVSFDSGADFNRKPDLSIVRRIGYVPQSALLFPHLTALRNVTLPLFEAQAMPGALALRVATEAMEAVGVADLAAFHPWRLSGGQQQRVAIARALAIRPDIFLLDEPTSAIDPKNAQIIAQALRDDVRNRMACGLVVTHNLAFAKRNCDSIALLADGKIQWHLRTDDVPIEHALMELG